MVFGEKVQFKCSVYSKLANAPDYVRLFTDRGVKHITIINRGDHYLINATFIETESRVAQLNETLQQAGFHAEKLHLVRSEL